jgi:hypothetical protein
LEEGEWGFCKLKGEEVEVEKKKNGKGQRHHFFFLSPGTLRKALRPLSRSSALSFASPLVARSQRALVCCLQ